MKRLFELHGMGWVMVGIFVLPVLVQLQAAELKGTYQYSLTTSGETRTVKVGEKHWYKHRDTWTVSRQLNWHSDPVAVSVQNGTDLGWTFESNGQLPLVTLRSNEYAFDGIRLAGFLEAKAQPGSRYHFDNVMGSGNDWDLGLSYTLSSQFTISQKFRFASPKWDFMYVVPMNVQSANFSGTGISEVFQGGYSDMLAIPISKSTDASNGEVLTHNLGWESPFRSSEAEHTQAMMARTRERIQQAPDLFSMPQLIGVPENVGIDVELKNDEAIQNGDTWQEQLRYRGLMVKPLVVAALPAEVKSEYFLSGWDEQPNVMELITRVVHFGEWMKQTSVSSAEEQMKVATWLRKAAIHVLGDPKNTVVRNSVKRRLFEILHVSIFQGLVPRLRTVVGSYESAVEETGTTIDNVMQPGIADVETIRVEIQQWLEMLKVKGVGPFGDAVRQQVEEASPEIDVGELKQELLETFRKAAYDMLKTKGQAEGFIQKIEADHDMLQGSEFNIEEIHPE